MNTVVLKETTESPEFRRAGKELCRLAQDTFYDTSIILSANIHKWDFLDNRDAVSFAYTYKNKPTDCFTKDNQDYDLWIETKFHFIKNKKNTGSSNNNVIDQAARISAKKKQKLINHDVST